MPYYLENERESYLAEFFVPQSFMDGIEEGKSYLLQMPGKNKQQLRAVWYGKRDHADHKDS